MIFFFKNAETFVGFLDRIPIGNILRPPRVTTEVSAKISEGTLEVAPGKIFRVISVKTKLALECSDIFQDKILEKLL